MSEDSSAATNIPRRSRLADVEFTDKNTEGIMQHVRRTNSFTLIVFAIACAAVSICGQTARASCGDYLYTKHSKPKPTDTTNQPGTQPTILTDADESHSAPEPCSGPSCRSHQRSNSPLLGHEFHPRLTDGMAKIVQLQAGPNAANWRPCIDHEFAESDQKSPLDRPPQQIC